MKNSLIDNKGTSLPHEKKTKLESQIAELKTQEQQIIKQLKIWENKFKKANNLANCLWTVEKFGDQFLTEAVENEKTKEQLDISWLECLIKNKFEFALKFEVGKEIFTELIFESVERKTRALQTKLDDIQSQLRHQERKFARLQVRRQSKTLLECEYRKSIGCLDEDWCDNCQVNYQIPQQSEALKGGAF